jgi:hypothetical protein
MRYIKCFIAVVLFTTLELCGAEWKATLNFIHEGVEFKGIGSFHRGLSRIAQQYTESREPEECVQDPIGESAGPKNSENVALACLQIILSNSQEKQSLFIHLFDERGGIETENTRFFSTVPGSIHRTHAAERSRMRDKHPIPTKYAAHNFQCIGAQAHSENIVYYILSRMASNIIKDALLAKDISNDTYKISGIVLHLHTRLDMCGRCDYSLHWELNDSRGFRDILLKTCADWNSDARQLVSLGVLVSSRQDYLVWGPSRRTLNYAPPFQASLGNDNYQQYLALVNFEDLSAKKEAAQGIIPPFLSPEMESSELFEAACSTESTMYLLHLQGIFPNNNSSEANFDQGHSAAIMSILNNLINMQVPMDMIYSALSFLTQEEVDSRIQWILMEKAQTAKPLDTAA